MTPRGQLRPLMRAACVALAALLTGPAGAAEPPPGSKNFSSPRGVPDFFSNESGPFRGGANARAVSPGGIPAVAAPVQHRGGENHGGAVAARRHGRSHPTHVARGRGGYRSAHRKAAAHGRVAHAQAGARRGGGSPAQAQARSGPVHAKTVAAKAPHHAAPGKAKHLAGVRG
jgi:hypothetical protein